MLRGFVVFASKPVEQTDRMSRLSETNEASVLSRVIDLLQAIKLAVLRGKGTAETKCDPLSASGNCNEALALLLEMFVYAY